LSQKHPLYDFFKYHCEGTVGHISISYEILVATLSPGDKYFAVGKDGFITISKKAFKERRYEKFSYKNLIEVD